MEDVHYDGHTILCPYCPAGWHRGSAEEAPGIHGWPNCGGVTQPFLYLTCMSELIRRIAIDVQGVK